jgi:hypothetical protein
MRTDILKINLYDSQIDPINIDLIKLNKNIHILGSFDINKDGLLDIIYIDSNHNVKIKKKKNNINNINNINKNL